MPLSAIEQARAALTAVTPLRTDCGRLCGAACCSPLEGEETGMLLFPGEAPLLGPGYRLKRGAGGMLAVCGGTCDRPARPLACMMFPLLPLLRNGAVRVAVDARARAVCPLTGEGLSAFDPAFVAAVRRCGEILAADADCRVCLIRLTRQHDDLKALRRQFRG